MVQLMILERLWKSLYGPLGFDRRSMSLLEVQKGTLSGQYNRLFPVKMVFEGAANLILNREMNTPVSMGKMNDEYEVIALDELRSNA